MDGRSAFSVQRSSAPFGLHATRTYHTLPRPSSHHLRQPQVTSQHHVKASGLVLVHGLSPPLPSLPPPVLSWLFQKRPVSSYLRKSILYISVSSYLHWPQNPDLACIFVSSTRFGPYLRIFTTPHLFWTTSIGHEPSLDHFQQARIFVSYYGTSLQGAAQTRWG